MLYVARRSQSLSALSTLSLILGVISAVGTPARAADEASAGFPPIVVPKYEAKTLKLPNFRLRDKAPLSEEARIRLSETLVEHSLQLAVTNAACDSSMSPSQCLEWLMSLPESAAPQFATVSLRSWAETVPEIDAVLERVVSKDTETMRWQMLRGLGLQARQTVAKLTRDASQSSRTTPEALLNLNATFGVARLEIVHRLIVSGDRIMVDHMVIDRTESNPRAAKKIDETTPQDIVDVTDALKANVEASMKAMAESTTANIAKSKLKK